MQCIRFCDPTSRSTFKEGFKIFVTFCIIIQIIFVYELVLVEGNKRNKKESLIGKMYSFLTENKEMRLNIFAFIKLFDNIINIIISRDIADV